MELYFVRHARAVSRNAWEDEDSQRPLTERGREDTVRMAGFVTGLGLRIDTIVTSPFKRAFDTADIMARELDMKDRLVSDERMGPGFGLGDLVAVVQDHPDAQALMLVGHEPDFSSVIGRMTGGRVLMKKGGIAYVESHQASLEKAELAWLVQPSVIGR